MEQNEEKNPHRMQAIAWRDGTEKEEVVRILNSPKIDKFIPENMKSYQGKNNAGKRVLWACRQLMLLADTGQLDMEKPMLGKTADVEALEIQVEELKRMLKQSQGGEVSYIETINQQSSLIRFYSNILSTLGIIVDEENLRYRTDKDSIWHVPIM